MRCRPLCHVEYFRIGLILSRQRGDPHRTNVALQLSAAFPLHDSSGLTVSALVHWSRRPTCFNAYQLCRICDVLSSHLIISCKTSRSYSSTALDASAEPLHAGNSSLMLRRSYFNVSIGPSPLSLGKLSGYQLSRVSASNLVHQLFLLLSKCRRA
jgi:hypothetical protein